MDRPLRLDLQKLYWFALTVMLGLLGIRVSIIFAGLPERSPCPESDWEDQT